MTNLRDVATYLKVMEWLQTGTQFDKECATLTLEVIADLRKSNEFARTAVNGANANCEKALQIVIHLRGEINKARDALEVIVNTKWYEKGKVKPADIARRALTQISDEIDITE